MIFRIWWYNDNLSRGRVRPSESQPVLLSKPHVSKLISHVAPGQGIQGYEGDRCNPRRHL